MYQIDKKEIEDILYFHLFNYIVKKCKKIAKATNLHFDIIEIDKQINRSVLKNVNKISIDYDAERKIIIVLIFYLTDYKPYKAVFVTLSKEISTMEYYAKK